MYFVTKTFNPGKGYSCVFRQPLADSHCRLAHGYDLIFQITLGTEKLDRNGWVFDFGALKPVEERIKATFDHKWLVAENDPHKDDICALAGLGIADVIVLPHVGCEAFALWLAAETFDLLHALKEDGRVRILHTKVSEHGANTAGYSPIALPHSMG